MTQQVEDATPRRARGKLRERKKASNRAALLAAARAVFAEMGFGAASVRDIVRRTDLATGTFYNYFEDKDAIFAAVVGELTDELVRRHRQGRARAGTAEEFLRRHFQVYFEFIAEDPELVALAQRNVTAIRTLLDKPDVRALHRVLIDDLREAMATGILPPLDVPYLAAAIGGIAFEISMVMVTRTPVDAVEAARFAARLALGGVNAARR
ncbi:MAG: TetR/AcrR family transcriptional regulator [Alphaproteobacteria bacterium]|nr:TetR/AcrR family transcriptional regulator [Alphaproteobacteria bacterium]MCW5742548.1 TetR/AcrR family transcriptional regulator [Alphaproteobacteria bacterium]